MEEGVTFRYTMYNKKEKAEGVTDYIISEVSYDSSNISATFDLKFTDNKGVEIYNSDFKISCSDNSIKIDYDCLFPTQMMQ
ncbi:TapB family protein [Maribacter antarcticus]|uniref:TapB family protein n=1 Tax=Maribacter antarcticus TaxID=505250 RepID=UPI00047C1C22|nr:hypothetical protein [Maribacter antarcticus]